MESAAWDHSNRQEAEPESCGQEEEREHPGVCRPELCKLHQESWPNQHPGTCGRVYPAKQRCPTNISQCLLANHQHSGAMQGKEPAIRGHKRHPTNH